MINLNTDIGIDGVKPDGGGWSMRMRGLESVWWRVMRND